MDSLVSIIESKQLELKEVVEQISFIGKEAKNSSANTTQPNKPKNTKKNNSKKSNKSSSKGALLLLLFYLTNKLF